MWRAGHMVPPMLRRTRAGGRGGSCIAGGATRLNQRVSCGQGFCRALYTTLCWGAQATWCRACWARRRCSPTRWWRRCAAGATRPPTRTARSARPPSPRPRRCPPPCGTPSGPWNGAGPHMAQVPSSLKGGLEGVVGVLWPCSGQPPASDVGHGAGRRPSAHPGGPQRGACFFFLLHPPPGYRVLVKMCGAAF